MGACKMKREKQVEKIIERCNEYLKNCYVTDESDDVFHMTCEMLLAAGCYKGYMLIKNTNEKYLKIL